MNKNVTVYLDMDGCLTNFSKRAAELYPHYPEASVLWKTGETKSERYKLLQKELCDEIKSVPNFWEDLEWMPNGITLWQNIARMFEDVYILTAPLWEDRVRCEAGKVDWVERHIPAIDECKIIIDWRKYNYVLHNPETQHAVLIDDKPSNIKRWKASGGLGILHEDMHVEKTVKALIELNKMTNDG